LNSSGSRIRHLIEQPAGLADIMPMLEREFDIEPEPLSRRDDAAGRKPAGEQSGGIVE